jgi:ubiquinone/menaquinone biosynthesis C-methylase UbiE
MSNDIHYDQDSVEFLESLWGDGYLSPGGPEEVARLLAGIDLDAKTVLDIGCGSGGITLSLARDYKAAFVIGIDVEEPVCSRAAACIRKAGLQDTVDIRQVSPGALPLEDASVDIVFSKDSIVHIENKEFLCGEAFRVLKPNGWFVASDWLISHDDEPSEDMQAYLLQEDLGFGMASPKRYKRALERAGFTHIELHNRNRWYTELAKRELADLTGSERGKYLSILGEAGLEAQTDTWRSMIPVLSSGEHCPHHFRGQKS